MTMAHITIHTADLEQSVTFYRDIIGLMVTRDFRKTVGLPIVFLSAGENGTSLELIQNAEKAFCGSGLSIGFHVEDVKAAHTAMTEKGLNPSPITSPNPNTEFFFIQDPNGLHIQLI